MNAIQVLMHDHEEIKGFFRQYEEAGKGAKKTKQKIVEETIKELESHTQIEEQIFYPAVQAKAKGELADLVLEGIEEHGVAKFLIEQLRTVGPEAETHDAKFKVLMESVEHHLKEEEKQMFPEAKKLLADDLDRLGKEMEQLHQRLEG